MTTSDEVLWRNMWAYKDHGKSYEAVYEREHPSGYRWLHDSFGTNWRMLEMQAVIGRIQLKLMAQWLAARTNNARTIANACTRFTALIYPRFKCNAKVCDNYCPDQQSCIHANYKFYVYINPTQLNEGWTRDKVIDAINAEGVPFYQGSCSEVYLEKAFDNTGWRPKDRLTNAQHLGETTLMFLVHPTLTDAEVHKTCDAISHVMHMANKA